MSSSDWTHERDDQRDPAERQDGTLAQPAHGGDPARLAATVGNQAFGAMLGRVGDGILPNGTAHPDVEAMIARTRGAGAALAPRTRERAAETLGDSLQDVRVHHDETADGLAQSVSARAFTTGSDIYFGRGEYQPGTSGGDELLTHELAHVVQQRGAPTDGPLTVSQPGDALENEAEAIAAEHDT
jgi:hypothetical protein